MKDSGRRGGGGVRGKTKAISRVLEREAEGEVIIAYKK